MNLSYLEKNQKENLGRRAKDESKRNRHVMRGGGGACD